MYLNLIPSHCHTNKYIQRYFKHSNTRHLKICFQSPPQAKYDTSQRIQDSRSLGHSVPKRICLRPQQNLSLYTSSSSKNSFNIPQLNQRKHPFHCVSGEYPRGLDIVTWRDLIRQSLGESKEGDTNDSVSKYLLRNNYVILKISDKNNFITKNIFFKFIQGTQNISNTGYFGSLVF